jgi:NAD(P)-dependent dehydrogenase (short-subunit alcohol dehydrogenase family)
VKSAADLGGQVVLITGAGSGIGAATAKELHARGAVPVLLDIDAPSLHATASGVAPGLLTHEADVTDPRACETAVAITLARYGRIDVVWANAGIASFGPLQHTDPAAWQRCVDVNVMGVFNTVRAALPAVLAQRGYVLVTASIASFAHPPCMSSYAASKAAVEAMCNAWRIELAAHAVRVGAVHASWVTTPLVTEGELHPGFLRLRGASPKFLQKATTAEDAAHIIANGITTRSRQIWVPGWTRWLHRLRALLHTPSAERDLLRAAPEIEAHYLAGVASEGVLASSFGPRELARAQARGAAQRK